MKKYLPVIGSTFIEILRILISALLTGIVTFGTTSTAVTASGQEPTAWQIKLSVIGGIVTAANDIKSRLTPSQVKADSNAKQT